MIYILITVVSASIAFLAYKYEMLRTRNNEILENYNLELERDLKKRTTQLIKQKQQLKDSEFRWMFAVEGSGDGLWDWNVKTNEVFFSKRWKEMLGFAEDEIKASLDEWENRVHPDDLEQVTKDITNHMEEKTQTYQNEHRVLCKNGKYKWVLDRGIVVSRDDKGNPSRIIGTHTDIDERKEYQNKIEMQRFKYKKLMENSSSAILITDMNAKVVEYSNQFAKLLGYSLKEDKDIYVYDFEYIHSKEQINANIKNVTDKPISFETKFKTKDGRFIDVINQIVKISIDSKDYIYSSISDITQQKLLLRKTKEQKEKFETIFHYAQDGIAITDLEGNFMNVNPAFTRLTGYSEEKLLNLNLNKLISPEYIKRNNQATKKAIETGKVENFEESYIVANKVKITINLSLSLLPDKKRLLLIVKDTSSLKLIEEQTKLASMTEMIGNIAHQWRQPLSAISTAASGMKVQSELGIKISNNDIAEFSDHIVIQTNYLSKTIDNFKSFIEGDNSYIDINVEELIEKTLTLVEASIKNNHILILTNIESNIIINGSLNELTEAFINIINNSKDALKENVLNEEDRLIFIDVKRNKDKEVEIVFKDTAGGIPDNIINRVFEPYFTSKHQSIGKGLGMSMVDKIIRQRHNGTIKIENQDFLFKGKKYYGACVCIRFDSLN